MPQRIQAPDGSIVEFPDGMSDEQMAAVMRREYGGADNRPKSAALGFYKGLMKPLDNGAMAMETGARAIGVPTDKINNIFGMPSAAEATDQRAQAFAEADKQPGRISEWAGNVVGTIPAALATKNPFIAGSAQGALLTDSRNPLGIAADAVTGGVTSWGVGKMFEGAADAISPAIKPAVRRLAEKGVKLTPGQIKGGKALVREEKRMSRPVVGSAIAEGRQKAIETFNTAAANEIMAPMGVKVPSVVKPGHDTMAFVGDTLDEAYGIIVPQMAVKIPGQEFAAKLAPSAQSLPKPQQQQLKQIISATLKNGQLQGQALKDAQGELRRLASTYSSDAAAPNRELGRILWQADDELTGAMMAQNPTLAPKLQEVNAAYRGYKTIADAASRADGGVFNTGQLKQAVRRGDKTRGKTASAKGEAFLQQFSEDGRDVLSAGVPNSGTADRMMFANPFAYAGGAKDAALYRGDELLQQFRLAPRPKAAAPAAKIVKRLKGPAATGAVAAQGNR